MKKIGKRRKPDKYGYSPNLYSAIVNRRLAKGKLPNDKLFTHAGYIEYRYKRRYKCQ